MEVNDAIARPCANDGAVKACIKRKTEKLWRQRRTILLSAINWQAFDRDAGGWLTSIEFHFEKRHPLFDPLNSS